jgi:RNA polymerase sigma factor for flagellar operon FliA
MMTETGTSPQDLIISCQGLVRSLARKVHAGLPRRIELDDLVSFGQVGLAEAARDFDPQRGNSFTTYAYYRIRGAIFDGLGKMAWFGRADHARLRFESSANNALELASGESESGNVQGDIRWLKQVGGTLAMAYLCSQASDEETDAAASLEDHSIPAPPTAVIQQETFRKLRELIDELPADAAALIRATYFEGLTLKEAGERIGISKAWASRLHARTLERLGRALSRLQLAD